MQSELLVIYELFNSASITSIAVCSNGSQDVRDEGSTFTTRENMEEIDENNLTDVTEHQRKPRLSLHVITAQCK